jgi:hypothetical protein
MAKERRLELDLELPEDKPLSPADAERRRRAVDDISRLREKIGPIEVTVPELLREVREGRDAH